MATYIFALSVVCVFLFMAALYESWIRPLVIILTVPLATFGAMVGLWLYDMPLDVFGQIGLVMLIGLETKNAILIVEFGVELMEKHGMSIIDSAKEASRQRLRPILMTSFAFVMGVLPMARATGAGAYSRNSLGIVIAFGIAVSTVLGRFVIPIYYVLGERLERPPEATGGARSSPAEAGRRWRRPRAHSPEAAFAEAVESCHRRSSVIRKDIIELFRVPAGKTVRLKDYNPGWDQTEELEELGKDALRSAPGRPSTRTWRTSPRPRTCFTPTTGIPS